MSSWCEPRSSIPHGMGPKVPATASRRCASPRRGRNWVPSPPVDEMPDVRALTMGWTTTTSAGSALIPSVARYATTPGAPPRGPALDDMVDELEATPHVGQRLVHP